MQLKQNIQKYLINLSVLHSNVTFGQVGAEAGTLRISSTNLGYKIKRNVRLSTMLDESC